MGDGFPTRQSEESTKSKRPDGSIVDRDEEEERERETSEDLYIYRGEQSRFIWGSGGGERAGDWSERRTVEKPVEPVQETWHVF